MIRSLFAAATAFLLASCATIPSGRDNLDRIAEDYRLLQLTIGEKEPGCIDAYYGPPEIQARAKAAAPLVDIPGLSRQVADLRARIAAPSKSLSGEDVRRARFLDAQLKAADTRLRMRLGQNLPFEDEAEALFGVRPQLRPLSEFDPILAKVEAMVPGNGRLADRLDTYNNQFTIPPERLLPVLQAGIAECRRRTLAHIPLPETERFDMALVTGKPWGAYNYYQGNYHSLIEVNTQLPVRLGAPITYGCHEGYPGHHVQAILFERELARGKGWAEYTLMPLYSPQSFLNEGAGDYGIKLAFPGDEDTVFKRDVLAPMAGVSTAELARSAAIGEATKELVPASYTIAAMFLAGTIDEAEFVRLTQRYGPATAERARQSLSFVKPTAVTSSTTVSAVKWWRTT